MRPNIKSCVSVVIMILLTVCTAVLLYGGTGSGIISVCIISFNVSEHSVSLPISLMKTMKVFSNLVKILQDDYN